MHLRTFVSAFVTLATLGWAANAAALCPCKELPDEVRWGGVGFSEWNTAFWGIVRAIDYQPSATLADIEVRRTYTARPVEDVVRVEINTESCAPEVRLGVGFLAVAYGQTKSGYRVQNCVYSALEPFERETIRKPGVPNLDALRELLEEPLRVAIANAVVACNEDGDALASFDLKLDVFTDGSWDFELTGLDPDDASCIHNALVSELDVPEHNQYPVSATARIAAGGAGAMEFVGIAFEKDSESVLRAALQADADDVAPSARLLRASRQLEGGDAWKAIMNVCIADGLAKAEALLDAYKPANKTLADLVGCATRRDDVAGLLRVLGDTTPQQRSLRQVLRRVSKRDLSIRPIADTGPLQLTKTERLAILSWARQQPDWVNSAVMLELVATAAANASEGLQRPTGVPALALHRASLLRADDADRFRELSSEAARPGVLDPRIRHRLTANFARAEERRRSLEVTAAEALAAARTADDEPPMPVDMGEVMEPEPQLDEIVEEEEPEDAEPLVDPAWCGLFGLFALLVMGNVVRRGLTSPS